uniref:Uncharacterized protein n=1 Tax=Anopheles atroparvus TaxID=41427 RepID=A0A182JKY1_ANOAO
MTPEKRRRPVTRASKSPSTPKSQQCSTLTRSSSENSSGELVIDVETDDDTPKHSKPDKDNELKDEKPTRVFRRKRRKMSLPDDADALFDAKFEETIRKSAAKNNLTPICVKKLLKKLVMNDHVFAIVRLKEEEEERKKNSMAENSQEGDDGDDEEDDEDVHTLPKLTRLKAKQLNQTLFPLVPLNAPATDKEVAALIREDLNSDDDDEEYKPGEDDVPSDDDPNTTISDIDSQPRTPATTVAVTGAETETELQYTKDGLFKIPKPRNDSYCSQSEQEQENIALRTRSKLCLTTTDIETLESTFIPPDITTDMYEYDGDMDQAWKDFLEEFTKPLPKDLEDDDDNDPEYVVADKVPCKQYNPQRLSGLLQLFHLQQVDGSLVVSARYISHRFDDYCSMEDKDARYAFNYYEKVEETLLASGRSDLLERFEEVLRAFNELEDSVTQLYYQVEELLGESFPELVDMFLTFLLPGQAAEVGRFFEHFILTNMNDFLEKLNIFFAKQPSQIKKVHACLNELSNEPNVTMDQVKLKVLPLLKGSTLLSEWFLQLFPSERPPESPLCDYENVTLKKPPHMESCEPGVVYEQVPYVEAVPESTENAAPPNAIRYIQGRIYQGALPARLTFLANNCLTKSDSTQGYLEQNLCDEATLKAHAIRLNPLVHCPKGITYADVAPLLTAGGNADGGMGSSREAALESVNTEDESKGASSPKKAPPKLPIKKRFNSPTSQSTKRIGNGVCGF